MASRLARLRNELDLTPSPIPDRPGLLLRDPFRYSDSVLVLPPILARCLGCFDGQHTDADLRDWLGRLTGQSGAAIADAADELARALGEAGFLDDPGFATLKEQRHRSFAEADVRAAVHAGG